MCHTFLPVKLCHMVLTKIIDLHFFCVTFSNRKLVVEVPFASLIIPIPQPHVFYGIAAPFNFRWHFYLVKYAPAPVSQFVTCCILLNATCIL